MPLKNESLNVAVVGAGAVGSLVAVLLEKMGCHVNLLGRGGKQPKPEILLNGKKEKFIGARQEITQAQIIFFAVKAYDLETAVAEYLQKISPGSVVVSLCNGYVVDVLKRFQEYRSDIIWRAGVVTLAVKEVPSGGFESVNDEGKVGWGAMPSSKIAAPVEKMIFALDVNKTFQWLDNPAFEVRKKWLFNTVINTLCAELRLARNGDLLKHFGLVEKMTQETYALGEKLWGKWPWSVSQFLDQMQKLIELTADNENSMARDVRLGRKTEKEFLGGLGRAKDREILR